MIYAVYRCLYGEDFIQASIRSIDPFVDKIFVFWDDTPWGDVTDVLYKGEIIKFPKKFDRVIERIKELNNPKIELIYDHQFNNFNQMQHFVNDIILPNYERPNTLFSIETDYVFEKDQLDSIFSELNRCDFSVVATSQVELWKSFNFRIPERPRRLGTILWNMKAFDKLPETGRHGEPYGVIIRLDPYVHNLGFCVSETSMYWKHLTALAFSQKIGDSSPNPDWFEKKWKSWDFETNNKDLEISAGREADIPYAEIYKGKLPEAIL